MGTQPYRGRCSLSHIGGAAALWGALSPIGGALRSALWGRCSAMGPFSPMGALQRYGGAAALWGAQPYRGRCSLSPIGALRRYGRSAL